MLFIYFVANFGQESTVANYLYIYMYGLVQYDLDMT